MYTSNPHLVELEDMVEVRALQFAKVAGENLLSLTVKLRDDLSEVEQEVHGLLLTDGVSPRVLMPQAQSKQEVQQENTPAEATMTTPATDNAPTTPVEGSDTTSSSQTDTKSSKGNKAVPVVPVSE